MRARLRSKLQVAFGQGMSADKIALSLTVGALMGIIPLAWGSCLLCVAISWRWRLNHPLVQTLNYALYPLQLASLVPFFYWGSKFFGGENIFNQELLLRLFHAPVALGQQLWQANLHALAVWAVLSALLFPFIYWFFLRLVQQVRTVR